ncbi:MAG: polysaccharide biosynthesis protein [Bacteroidetes bacterium]|nr:polysaccharide biosynthesis protein [Bacteroidota bacterium]
MNQQPTTNNQTIAKNTIFLYFRMMVIMLVTLYTSRVVLQTLGVEDFGLYAVVGGVVGMLSFLNGALSTGSSRFLAFELGTRNFEKLQKTFSTLLNTHIIIAIIVVILAETIGLWFVYNKLVIPSDRMNAALWVYHISVLTAVITMTQVPYNASIISHEKMNVFAYVSIVEVSLKLGVVYLLKVGNYDKLILYAILLCIVTMGIALFYRFYCVSKFKETHYKFLLDKDILKSVGGFSGWSLFAQVSIALNEQGTNIITGIFFSPAVVAARAISTQVNMTAMQFIQNFRTAVNPQIVKKYAAEDYIGSKQLLLNSAKFSFYLMLLLGLPIILLAEPLLQLWLGQVPEYSVIFLQLIIIQSLFSVFDTSFYTALYAKGQLRENALISPLVGFIRFPIIYFLFKAGFSPVTLSYAGVISYALLGLVIKPILICKIANYTFQDIMNVFSPCLKVCLIAIPIPILAYYYVGSGIINFIIVCFVSTVCILVTVFYVGVNKDMRNKIVSFIKSKLKK